MSDGNKAERIKLSGQVSTIKFCESEDLRLLPKGKISVILL
ncbi:hypothetical protein [uncultured Bartonella sp.]|nr:hypothetical protein [uncultured Bartonella sp.]